MPHVRVRLALGGMVALSIVPACSSALAEPASALHFVTVTGGYARYMDEERHGYTSVFDGGLAGSNRANLSDAAELGLRYRYAVRPGTEVFAEFDRIEVSGTETLVDLAGSSEWHPVRRTDSWGIGCRASDIDGRLQPFFQAGLVFSRQWSGLEGSLNHDGNNLGFGATAGVDIGVTRSLSIPIELAFRFATPLEEVATLGLRSGLTWSAARSEAHLPELSSVPDAAPPPAPPAPPLHVAMHYGVGGHVGTIQPETYAYPFAHMTDFRLQSTLPGSSVGDFFDLAPGTAMGIAFRGSIRPGTDVVFEGIRAVSVRSETYGGISVRRSRYSTLSIGLGMRKTRVRGRVRPFAQAGLALMDTGARFLSADSGSRVVSGLATNFVTGAEIVASRTLSIPVECRALIGWTGGDQAHVGVQAGLAYGFGQ